MFETTGRNRRAADAAGALSKRTDAVKRPLYALIVEDSENDALLIELELQRAGYQPVCERVQSAQAMRATLQRGSWDIVIADYVMPHFNGLAALRLVRELGLDLPFIVVSGHISDATAVEAMKAGAHDYVMKDNLARLPVAVERELREAGDRRERRRTEDRLKLETSFRLAVEDSVPAGIAVVDLEGRQSYVNPAFCGLVGWTENELVGARPPFVYWPPEDIETITSTLARVSQKDGNGGGAELRYRRRNNERLHVLVQITPLRDTQGEVTGWVSSVSDITERKQAEVRLAAEHAITRILSHALSLDEAAPGIVQVLLDALEMDVGTLWLPDERLERLHPSVLNVRPLSPKLKAFLEESRRFSFEPGVLLPGWVWQKRRPIWLNELEGAGQFVRSEAAGRAELRSGLAFPIQNGGDFFGVVEFFAGRSLAPDQTILNMMGAIGSEIGQFVQRRSAEAALRRAHDDLEMRVQHRTAELKTANQRLESAIAERKRLEHELLEITENERRRIGLDLHDDLGQRLSGIALMTKGLSLRLAKARATEAREAERIHGLIQEAMSHASDVAHDLATLDSPDNDLPAALGNLAARARQLFRIACGFRVDPGLPTLDSGIVTQLYKIAQEGVTNAIKHGKASRVRIRVELAGDNLVLTVRNNGKPLPDLKPRATTGMGLRIISHRARLIGGEFDIRNGKTSGAVLTCTVPIAKVGVHNQTETSPTKLA